MPRRSVTAVVLAALTAMPAASQDNSPSAVLTHNVKFLEPVVTIAGTAQHGHTTYSLSLHPRPGADVGSIYTIYGDRTSQMTFPPAFQADAPFGCDIGGVNPAFYAYSAAAAADSWLSVGVSGGNNNGAIASIGIDFDSWDDTGSLVVDDGAVFWMDPIAAPQDPMNGGLVQIGQLTVPTGTTWHAVVNAQGKNRGLEQHKDWEDHGIVFTNGAPPPPPPPPPPAVRPPPPPPPRADRARSLPPAGNRCTSDTVSSTFAEIPAACCTAADDCANGFPAQCSKECGALVVPFWESCEGYMNAIPGYGVMEGLWQNFVDECRAPGGRAVPTTFRCEYTELLPIALECSSTEMDAADFCSSDCATELLPMVQQCASRPAFEDAIQLLVGRPVGKLVSNCVAELVVGGMSGGGGYH